MLMRLHGTVFLPLLVLAMVLASGCTGGPRPTLSASGDVHHDAAPPQLLAEDYRLGPSDIVGLTFLSLPQATVGDYRLQVGDTLLVEFHRNEYLNRSVIIRPDGKVTAPYLGDVKAAGLTTNDLSEFLRVSYKDKDIFNDLQLTLSVVSFNARLKELQAAIANSASGQTKDLVINQDGMLRLPMGYTIEAVGKSIAELDAAIRETYAPVLPTCVVQTELRQARSNVVYVIGEVNQPGPIQLNTPATVTQVVAMAGGYKPGSGMSSVVLIRPDDQGRPMGSLVDVESVLAKGNLGADRLVRRYDVVYVPPSLIQKLNDGILFYVRNMMPLQTYGNVGFQYLWGPAALGTSSAGSSFTPF